MFPLGSFSLEHPPSGICLCGFQLPVLLLMPQPGVCPRQDDGALVDLASSVLFAQGPQPCPDSGPMGNNFLLGRHVYC